MMNAEKISEMTALGRPLDPTYRTNQIIMIVLPVAAIVGFVASLLAAQPLVDALASGVLMAVAVFSAWAVSREIDHDHPKSAFVAAGIVAGVMLFYGLPDLDILIVFGAMMFARTVSRIVGPPARFFDTVTMLGLVALMGITGNWLGLIVAAIGFGMDGILALPLRRHLYIAIVPIIAAVIVVLVNTVGLNGELSLLFGVFALLTGAAYLYLTATTTTIEVGCDMESYALDINRVRAAMLLVLLFAVLPTLWLGDLGALQVTPLWSAMLATVIWRIVVLVAPSLRARDQQPRVRDAA